MPPPSPDGMRRSLPECVGEVVKGSGGGHVAACRRSGDRLATVVPARPNSCAEEPPRGFLCRPPAAMRPGRLRPRDGRWCAKSSPPDHRTSTSRAGFAEMGKSAGAPPVPPPPGLRRAPAKSTTPASSLIIPRCERATQNPRDFSRTTTLTLPFSQSKIFVEKRIRLPQLSVKLAAPRQLSRRVWV